MGGPRREGGDTKRQLYSRRAAAGERFGRNRLLALALLLVVAPSALAELPSDRLLHSLNPTADVNDYAGVLAPAEEASLEERCRKLRQDTGAQLAVVTLKSLEGGQIDDFANKLFARWGIGEKDKKNGVLILVAIRDRKARIEVGYGLEPILPDALAGRILNEQLFPAFRQQRYAAGLTAAVDRIVAIIQRNEPAPIGPDRQRPGKVASGEVILALTAFTVFVAIGSFVTGLGLRFGARSGLLFGLLFAGIPFLLGCLLAFPMAPLLHVPVGLFLGWLGWRVGRMGPRSSAWPAWGPTFNTWNWGNTSSSSGWSSGGGFSGSDWGGFGGGSSGGGGASGGW